MNKQLIFALCSVLVLHPLFAVGEKRIAPDAERVAKKTRVDQQQPAPSCRAWPSQEVLLQQDEQAVEDLVVLSHCRENSRPTQPSQDSAEATPATSLPLPPPPHYTQSPEEAVITGIEDDASLLAQFNSLRFQIRLRPTCSTLQYEQKNEMILDQWNLLCKKYSFSKNREELKVNLSKLKNILDETIGSLAPMPARPIRTRPITQPLYLSTSTTKTNPEQIEKPKAQKNQKQPEQIKPWFKEWPKVKYSQPTQPLQDSAETTPATSLPLPPPPHYTQSPEEAAIAEIKDDASLLARFNALHSRILSRPSSSSSQFQEEETRIQDEWNSLCRKYSTSKNKNELIRDLFKLENRLSPQGQMPIRPITTRPITQPLGSWTDTTKTKFKRSTLPLGVTIVKTPRASQPLSGNPQQATGTQPSLPSTIQSSQDSAKAFPAPATSALRLPKPSAQPLHPSTGATRKLVPPIGVVVVSGPNAKNIQRQPLPGRPNPLLVVKQIVQAGQLPQKAQPLSTMSLLSLVKPQTRTVERFPKHPQMTQPLSTMSLLSLVKQRTKIDEEVEHIFLQNKAKCEPPIQQVKALLAAQDQRRLHAQLDSISSIIASLNAPMKNIAKKRIVNESWLRALRMYLLNGNTALLKNNLDKLEDELKRAN
jgi:hypothetical protein